MYKFTQCHNPEDCHQQVTFLCIEFELQDYANTQHTQVNTNISEK